MLAKNPIVQSTSQWFQRNFSDPGAMTLVMSIVFAVIILELFGAVLMPVLVSLVLAYLLHAPVRFLTKHRWPHILAVLVVYILFLGVMFYSIFGFLPLLFRELSNLINQLPKAFTEGEAWFEKLIKHYPRVFSGDQITNYAASIQHQLANAGQILLKYALAAIPDILHILIYLILVPLFVLFFLKDSQAILAWVAQYKPRNRGLSVEVWGKMNTKIGAYVKGRAVEVIIVGVVTAVTFSLLGLQYAILLGVALGVAVIIPYVGAFIVTIPIVIIALLQYGLSMHFVYVMIAYAVIITLDGNVLATYLFSESMNLHPVVIILAVVVFGGLWGFWGVFFSIPLATLIDIILRSWPTTPEVSQSKA